MFIESIKKSMKSTCAVKQMYILIFYDDEKTNILPPPPPILNSRGSNPAGLFGVKTRAKGFIKNRREDRINASLFFEKRESLSK